MNDLADRIVVITGEPAVSAIKVPLASPKQVDASLSLADIESVESLLGSALSMDRGTQPSS